MTPSTWLLLLSAALAADPGAPATSARTEARDAVASANDNRHVLEKSADHRDVLLLLDDGPLHLRLHFSLGGQSLTGARQQFVADLSRSLDADGDGKLSRDEAQKSPLLRTKIRPSAAQFLESLKAKSLMNQGDVARAVERVGGSDLVVYRQESSSSQNDQEVFKLLDTDGSGTLEASELQLAGDLVLSKDEDGDECVTFQEFFPPAPPPDPLQVAMIPTLDNLPAVSTLADRMLDASRPLDLNRLLKRYDRDRSRQLDARELGWPAERLARIDTNQNGSLDPAELARVGELDPDLEMGVDLQASADGGRIEVQHVGGRRLDDATRADYAKIGFGPAVVTFSHRNLDPIASSLDDAMREFNLLDLDANGYLDRTETSERIRFVRDLFELMDADGDDKVFADEMKDYVRGRAAPAASTCKISLYDTGNGFFMALDTNADGRVSIREMRQAGAALSQLERDGKQGLSENEPVRHFHIEFVRGTFNLFGPSEVATPETPAFQQRRPTGPIWFQRMDRNNDGDLTWNEFLGPREVFHQLDRDADGLVDPTEAAKAQ